MKQEMISEVLAPAGSYEGLTAAVMAGADAVYVGGDRFGARAYAENFDTDALISAINFVHLHQKKLYLTVNTLLKEDERREQLYDYISPLYEAGLDAVIVQDLGVLSFIRRQFPDLPVHASTQMTVTGPEGAKELEALGVTRVVPARELSLAEIRQIREETNLEIETFVHGALCYCYSGQCLFSSMLGGRSGNRGRCAQPCRKLYSVTGLSERGETKPSYLLSPKDIATLSILPDIIEAGVDSLKIEGRMKKPEYAALVTAMYRKYVDLYREKGRAGYRVDEADMLALMDIYNRGGFTEGYYKKRNGAELMSLQRPNHTGVEVAGVLSVKGRRIVCSVKKPLFKGDVLEIPCKAGKTSSWTQGASAKPGSTIVIKTEYDPLVHSGEPIRRVRREQLLQEIQARWMSGKKPLPAEGQFVLKNGSPASLTAKFDGFETIVYGSIPDQAVNQSVTKEQLARQLGKTGNTPFFWDTLSIDAEAGLFFPSGELNRMRREALESLERQITGSYRRTAAARQDRPLPAAEQTDGVCYTALITRKEQLAPVLEVNFISRVYVEMLSPDEEWPYEALRAVRAAGKECYFALPLVLRSEKINRNRKFFLYKEKPDGLLVRNLEELGYAKRETDLPIVADAGLYSFNSEARAQLFRMGCRELTVPYELTKREWAARGGIQDELVIYGYQPLMVTAGCIKKIRGGCDRRAESFYLNDRNGSAFPVETRCATCMNIIYNSVPLYLADWMGHEKGTYRYQFTIESESETRDVLEGKKPARITRGHFKNGVE